MKTEKLNAEIVRPGDKLLISIEFLNPNEFSDSESCHQDIVLEDFLASVRDPVWRPMPCAVLRREETNG
jgi:hypothetical protein